MGSGRDALEAELGGRTPPPLTGLDDEHFHDLANAVATARRRQAREIAEAGDQALSHMPKLLRVAIRKVTG